MAHILLHTSSKMLPLKSQALRLQQELQIIGHTVEFSYRTHPYQLLKNRYDVFHVLSDTTNLSLIDAPLVLLAKLNRTATVISQYGTFDVLPSPILNQFGSHLVDAYSATDTENLKAQKSIRKNKFILPLLPTEIKIKNLEKSKELLTLKFLSKNFQELLTVPAPNFVDASQMTIDFKASAIRKSWTQFQAKHPQYKKSILTLSLINSMELMRSHSLIFDLCSVKSTVQFQNLSDLACSYQQFVVLNQKQASGYAEFWIHDQNCWISDIQSQTSFKPEQIALSAKNFFKLKNSESMKISIENKINELSRIYAKIMYEKSLTYQTSEAR